MVKAMIERAGRRIAMAIAVVLLVVAMPHAAMASTTQEKLDQAKKEKQQTESALQQTKEQITGMQGEKNSLQGQLAILNNNLEEVSDNLERLEGQIDEKKNQIDITTEALEDAEKRVAEQYECMKKRIKFIYEKSQSAYLELLFTSKGFGDLLNKATYIEQISAYDRKMLEEYRQTQKEIEETKAKLEGEKEELDGLRQQTADEQDKVSGMVKNTAKNIAGYADQISQAEAVADQYEAKVKEQEANIAALQKQLAEEQAMSKLAAQSAWRDISEVSFAEGDRELLANLIYCEAGGEPYAGKLAVGAVVINRVLSSVYPDSVVGVIYQRKQFSPVGSGRLALALADGKANSACYQAADEAMSGVTNVGNCVYFRTPIPGLTGISIGGHIFY